MAYLVEKRDREGKTNMVFHTLITDDVKRQIIEMVEDKIPANDQVRFTICERQAALAIIRCCLGDDYFKREFRVDADFDRTKQYPASKYVSHATAENLIRIKRLAQCVEDLYECKGFERKRKELGGTRFDNVTFELLIASYFREMGCEVMFLGDSSRKSCEFLLDNCIHVECKFMKNWTTEMKELESKFTNYLEETAAKVPSGSKGILVAAFPVDHRPNSDELAEIGCALQIAVNRISENYVEWPDKVLAVRVLAEITTKTDSSSSGIEFKRIMCWRAPSYWTLPVSVRNAIEDNQERIKPRTWVDYKGLSKTLAAV